VFAPLPAQGHLNPMLAVADELVRRGEQVLVLAPSSLRDSVVAGGARWVPLPDGVVPDPGRADGAQLGPRHMLRMIRALRRPPAALLALTGRAAPPGVVVYDKMTGWRPDVAGAIPPIGFATSMVVNETVAAGVLAAGLGRVLDRAAGRPDPERTARLRRWLCRVRAGSVIARLPLLASLRPDPVLTISSIPPAFQPAVSTFGPSVRFVGPCVGHRATDVDDPLLADVPADGPPLVLVSLGTTPVNHRPAFFRACVKAATGRPWRLVVAVGDRTDPAWLGPAPPNVTLTRRMPQLALLDRAALFVSHAGMNSVMEALRAGVPLLMHPQQPEQSANARRVAALGAGRVLDRATLGADAIRTAVEAALGDAGLRAGAARLAAELATTGGVAAAADAMQAHADRYAVAAPTDQGRR
jgi:MGT family glycosyltransferase